jgi:hypothetical protein
VAASCNAEPRSLPAVVGVHKAASFQPAGRPRRPEQLLEAVTSTLGMGARSAGAAARGAADLRPSCGSTLGCVVYQHAGARIPRTPTRSSALVTRGAAPGVAAASTVPAPKTLHADQFTGSSHGDGEHKGMGGPGAASRRGRSQARLDSLCSRPKRAGAWPQPCLRTRGLAVPARCSHLVARGADRSQAATHPTFPAQENTARRPVPNTFLAWRRRRPRARTAQEPPPSRYGSPVARWPATRHVQTGDASRRRRFITGKRPRGGE